jgi:hypothetical protein
MFLASCGPQCFLELGEDVAFMRNGAIGPNGAGGALFLVNADALQSPVAVTSCDQQIASGSSCNNTTDSNNKTLSSGSRSSSQSSTEWVKVPEPVLTAIAGRGNYAAGGSYGPDLASVPVQLGRLRIEYGSLGSKAMSSRARSSRRWGMGGASDELTGMCTAVGQDVRPFAWLEEAPLAVEGGTFFDLKVSAI